MKSVWKTGSFANEWGFRPLHSEVQKYTSTSRPTWGGWTSTEHVVLNLKLWPKFAINRRPVCWVMAMYIIGLCRCGNSVAELQGWPTSRVLLDTDTNGFEDPAASLQYVRWSAVHGGGGILQNVGAYLSCYMTPYHTNSNLYGLMNSLEKRWGEDGHRCRPPVHQHPYSLIIYTEACMRSIRGLNLDQITAYY